MVEDEIHLVKVCRGHLEIREDFYNRMENIDDIRALDGVTFLRRILQKDMVKGTGRYLESLMENRRKIMYTNG